MSETTTVARPYAKAVFQLAVESQAMLQWSDVLHNLTTILSSVDIIKFVTNPSIVGAMQADFILDLLYTTMTATPEFKAEVGSFVRLLIINKRLLLVPEIYVQFAMLRAEAEKKMHVEVVTFAALSAEQEVLLVQRLGRRLQREITLQVILDPSLLGGAVIKAGDLVIDDSVRTKLVKLGSYLAA